MGVDRIGVSSGAAPAPAGRAQGFAALRVLASTRVVSVAGTLLLAAAAILLVRISLGRAFAVDEFAYAHAGWLIANGAIPYVDFFETKFSTPLWIFSVVFSAAGDDPHLIQALRVLIWPFLGAVVAAAASLNRGIGLLACFATAILLVANPVFANTAIEIRPDMVALAGLMAALALIARGGRRPATGVAIGVCLGLCAAASAKAAIFAAPLALAWGFERVTKTVDEDRIFPAPWAVAAGFALVLLAVLAHLAGTGSLESFFAQAIEHNRKFLVGERWRPWQLDVVFVLAQARWLHVLALLGLLSLLAGGPRPSRRDRRIDVLLVLLLVSSFASHALQLYPFLYSLLPFMAIEAVFAGRGLAWLGSWIVGSPDPSARAVRFDAFDRLRPLVAMGLIGWSAIGLAASVRTLSTLDRPSNRGQLDLLREIDRLSGRDDAIYDNSASYVTRRSAYFLPWTDAPIRALWADKLVREVPLAIEASECVVAVLDERFASLPPALKAYLQEHFKPYRGPILTWGTDFRATDGRVVGRFLANRSGRYGVLPASVGREGELLIDGRPVEGGFVELTRGSHEVRYRGSSEGLRLQWAPEDDRPAVY